MSTNFNEQELFKGKSFSSLLKDIYTTTKNKEKQINILISELKPLVKNIGDATIIVPLIKEYLEVGVKNDEHLVKMAAVVQRAMTRTEAGGGDFLLTESEKQQLLDTMNDMEDVKVPKGITIKDELS
tara:strand:+ start:1872 stop:2252 length:381 start_codon:yes stop_codon:yes gene_type:complete